MLDFVENRMHLGKVRAFFNRHGKKRDEPLKKLSGVPALSALSRKLSAPGRARKILEMFGRIGYHKIRKPERKEEAKWRR